jgi:hypothetical protein
MRLTAVCTPDLTLVLLCFVVITVSYENAERTPVRPAITING